MSDAKLVLLGRFYNPTLGHIAKDLLESKGIHSFIIDAEHTAVPWDIGLAMNAIRLMVLDEDMNMALQILKENDIEVEK